MRARRTVAAAALVPALAAAGCAAAGADGDSVARKDRLVIGVNADQPGLGLRGADGSYSGFDIDIAREIAKRLGVAAGRVRFAKVTSAVRETVLRDRDVDLVVASYSITPERRTKVAFAGPYYVAHQDVLVRASESGRVKGVRDLAGRRLCEVPGSVSFPRVTQERGVRALSVKADGYAQCLQDLVAGKLDAVSTDDLILGGLSRQNDQAGGPKLKVVNAPISDEPYGVGLRRGDVDGCEAVNKAITMMYQDGTAQRLLRNWFSSSGLTVTPTVPQFEGCD
ncbi:glutamate ABC transporter substrate-binding protein [Actinomadura parmotrematis]|uniref:Glutamate ABC transporter substrate-binding protein n=1 Tax=Actinomadura parmotrematis TaxID=2864039 RepID=A0ABS7G2E3_9ACTN|nr:glutamate ABC transporter substrate-binding protein [Actinomadura parmotrematis]MBW8485997.1 glutamate ABC transporter substrate-binding protein [Actinomadura parmotrematis]